MKLTLANLHHYAHEEGECLLWKQGVNSKGSPQAALGGKRGVLVRRYIFTQLMGKTVLPKWRVCTSCDDKLCISPEHLVQRTASKVLRRSYTFGKRASISDYLGRLKSAQVKGWSVLTWEQVRAMRSRPWKNYQEAATAFGVSRDTASRVLKGDSWRESWRLAA